MTLNPIRLMRRRRRLQREVDDAVRFLRHAHGDQAYAVALARVGDPGLTGWGRQIAQGAADQLRSGAPARKASAKGLVGILSLARR